ncbi:MAG: hypothetical protein H6704_17435 [Myxococcales bacterium]|nr:hypothetical protein [Myxococcales bacterium]
MLWAVGACLCFLVVVPPLVAAWESVRMRGGSRDVGFWALARAVAGSCHVPWGRRGSPVVRFPLPVGEGRARALRQGGGRWIVEGRAYLRSNFGFAARICAPPAPPARWRAPGLAVARVYPEETEHLQHCSLETTDERLLRWLLRHAETRRLLDGLEGTTGAPSAEVTLAGSVVIVRALAPRGWGVGAAMEHVGPAVVEVLRRLSADLEDLASALEDAGDEALVSAPCAGCGATIEADPWLCPGCGTPLHRGCREMLVGCAQPSCGHAADALPARRPPRAAAEVFEEALLEGS